MKTPNAMLKVCQNQNLDLIKPDDFELVIYKVTEFNSDYNLEKITC